METCAGCDKKAKTHPMVGVGKNDAGEMVKVPVCTTCHEDPRNRKHPLKYHFFPRANGNLGLAAARLTDEVSKAGGDIDLGSEA